MFMHIFNVMRYKDTTDPSTYRQLKPLLTDEALNTALEHAGQIRFRIAGVYHSRVGPDWSSAGREESDYFHYIHLAFGGRAQIRHRGADFELLAGSAYFLTGNTPVERVTACDYESYVLKFGCESPHGADLLLDWPGRGPRQLGVWNRECWETMWRQQPGSLGACLALHGQLALWLAAAFPELDKIYSHHLRMFARYGKVLELLESRLSADLRISELAAAYGASLHAFSIAFTRDTGMSPKSYLNRRLNQEACRLLAGTDLPLKETAGRLGFADEYYFSRFFLKMNGVRPGRYRQTHVAASWGKNAQPQETA